MTWKGQMKAECLKVVCSKWFIGARLPMCQRESANHHLSTNASVFTTLVALRLSERSQLLTGQ